MRIHHRILLAAAIATSAGAGLFAAAPAAIASSSAAEVTIVHGIPGAAVTVYVDGKVLINHFVFGGIAGPVALKPGTHAVAIRNYGAKSTAKPIVSENLALSAGENASVVADLTSTGRAQLSFLDNPTSAVTKGFARLDIRHLAAAPAVDVFAGTVKVGSSLTSGNQLAVSIQPGLHTMRLQLAGSSTVVLGPTKYTLATGTTTILYVFGSAAGKSLTFIRDTY